jgi:hypothetical protein
MIKLPARQVHLDFHTSEHVPAVGKLFDKKQWQAALRQGRVNSITVFAKCHHSWSYYPTAAGMVHPTLKRNLLGEQIEACHQIGVRAPIYITVGWSENDALMHPEWVARRADGSQAITDWGMVNNVPSAYNLAAKPTDPRPIVCWKYLCPWGGYLELILAQTREVCDMFDVDGLFYDICFGPVCHCDACRAAVRDAGGDPSSPADMEAHNTYKWQFLMRECESILRQRHGDATLYFNGGAGIYTPQWHGGMTHFEMEDLPTTWGGYDKLPVRARYFANSGKQFVAMSGKFHTAWGEFGGFKHPDAIRYEAAAMLAFGARCNFGDQMHPSGEMDRGTYANIGQAYQYVEQLEPYALDGVPAGNLGIVLSGKKGQHHDQGVASMLLESQIDFRVVDDATVTDVDCAILTGDVRLDKASARRYADYVAAGGRLLLLGASGLDAAGKRFMLDVGARYLGPARFEQDYLLAGESVAAGLPPTPFLNYEAAVRIRPTDGQPLAAIREPYFDRTYGKFCSHQNTPYQLKDAPHPAGIRKGNVVYLAHALGAMYGRHGARAHRDYFINALRLVYPRQMQRMWAGLPSAGRATFIHQPQHGRYVVHLLYAPPLQRGRCQVIEDLPALHDVPVELRVAQRISRAYLAPQNKTLRIARTSGMTKVTVPRFSCHQAVVMEYRQR